jgi:hypothetical protein
MTEEDAEVEVVEESAVIVWDEKSKMQHFIRRANFHGDGKSLDFLVPTPSKPQLAKADDAVFDQLETIIKPDVVYKERPAYRLRSVFNHVTKTFNAAGIGMSSAESEPVEVIKTQRVGAYDATILRATDAPALARWLKKNGYRLDTALEKWLDVYIQKRWYITAFKVAKTGSGGSGFALAPVRMSFQTPRPFYPYREPQQAVSAKGEEESRSLRVFFFARHRMAATPGHFKSSQRWPGQVTWADEASKHQLYWARLASHLNLPESQLKSAGRLTVFEDDSTPRPGTDDVFFAQAANTQKLPEPITVIKRVDRPVYIEFLLLSAGSVVALGIFGRKRFKKA